MFSHPPTRPRKFLLSRNPDRTGLQNASRQATLIVLSLFVLGCQDTDNTNVDSVKKYITYFQDEQTGLCFASVNSTTYVGYEVTSIACVPCEQAKAAMSPLPVKKNDF